MFYDEKGKHIRTKKEILDDEGNIRSSCKIIPKGEAYEEKFFEKKLTKFKEKDFLSEVKTIYAEKMNEKFSDSGYKMAVFDKNGPYLPTKIIGNNNPNCPHH